jgi:hypothetical protein
MFDDDRRAFSSMPVKLDMTTPLQTRIRALVLQDPVNSSIVFGCFGRPRMQLPKLTHMSLGIELGRKSTRKRERFVMGPPALIFEEFEADDLLKAAGAPAAFKKYTPPHRPQRPSACRHAANTRAARGKGCQTRAVKSARS